MLLTVNVPEDANPELKARIRAIIERLNTDPEFAEEVPLENQLVDDEWIQRMFSSERIALIEEADAEIDKGLFYTSTQVDEHLKSVRSKWLQDNQL